MFGSSLAIIRDRFCAGWPGVSVRILVEAMTTLRLSEKLRDNK